MLLDNRVIRQQILDRPGSGTMEEKISVNLPFSQMKIPPESGCQMGVGMGGTANSNGDIFLHAISFVSPPKCNVCGAVMIGASDIEWACPTVGCIMKGIPQNFGWYPVKPRP